ncbi:MAG: ADP-ribosylglycohydrolase family protein [Oscillibacter sp.]|nr:ADP-ribosylglycohydrolase family protein [Oscillibacter sp.]
MYGAIIGDIIGSVYEWDRIKTKDFPLFSPESAFTDDSVMTVAIAKALLRARREGVSFRAAAVQEMRSFGRRYPDRGYGGRFHAWLSAETPRPYKSYGNGSAMRVSPCGLIASTLEGAVALGAASAEVTHNHPEGIKGAEAVAAAIWLAKSGADKTEIRAYLQRNDYPLDQTLDQIRPHYRFDETCQGSVPEALTAFLESESYEDAVRNAVSLGGDSDTQAAIAGSVAWAFYGRGGLTPDMDALRRKAESLLPDDMLTVIHEFEQICVE